MVDDPKNNAKSDLLIDGRYRVIEKIGEGGMGQVFLCTDTKFDRKVAVKLLRLDASNISVQRFHVEAKALAQANHQNILTILDFGAEGNQLFIVAEYIDGASLSSIIFRDGAMPLADALPILVQMCDGLSNAHSRKILHRDIKPSNVMLVKNKDGRFDVKLVDFGLAKQVQSDQYLTKTGVTMGTPPYMSPETASGQELDERSDLYSLGCLMFELLTGNPPFLGSSHVETMTMHVNQPAPTLFDYSDTVFPARVEEIVSKCLRKNPSDRFQTANELAHEIKQAIKAGATAPVTADTTDDTRASEQKNASKIGWKIPLVMIIAFVLLSAGSFLYFDQITKPLEEQSTANSFAALKSEPIGTVDKDVIGDGVEKLASEELKPQTIESYDQSTRQSFLNITGEASKEQLKTASEKYRHLKIVSFYRSPLRENNGLQYFANFPVEELRIDQTPMSDNDYRYIAKMTKLKTLRLTNSNQIPIDAIDSFAKLRELETLEIKNIGSKDGQFDAISRLPKLSTLILRNYDIDKSSIVSLQHNTRIRSLAFQDCNLAADSFSEIKEFGNLENLTFFNVPLKPKNLRDLGALRVNRLQISTETTSDYALLQLTHMTGLKELDLRGTPMSANTDQKLRNSLPKVKILAGELPQLSNSSAW